MIVIIKFLYPIISLFRLAKSAKLEKSSHQKELKIVLLEKLFEKMPPSKSMQVFMYILEHIDEDGVFSRTYAQIQKDTGASQPTISHALTKLQELGYIEKVGQSKWLVKIVEEWSDEYDNSGFYVEHKGT